MVRLATAPTLLAAAWLAGCSGDDTTSPIVTLGTLLDDAPPSGEAVLDVHNTGRTVIEALYPCQGEAKTCYDGLGSYYLEPWDSVELALQEGSWSAVGVDEEGACAWYPPEELTAGARKRWEIYALDGTWDDTRLACSGY